MALVVGLLPYGEELEVASAVVEVVDGVHAAGGGLVQLQLPAGPEHTTCGQNLMFQILINSNKPPVSMSKMKNPRVYF